MKKVLVLILFMFILNNFAFANTNVNTNTNNTPQPLLVATNSKPEYLKYYIIDDTYLNMFFVPISKNDYNKLIKEQKKIYKTYVKYSKKIQKGYFYDVLLKDKYYLPAYVAGYRYYAQKKDYQNTIIYLKNIKALDKYDLFNKDILDFTLAMNHFDNNDYQETIDLLLPQYYSATDNKIRKSLAYFIGSSFFYLKNYPTAINYISILDNTSYNKHDILFVSYYNLKNNIKAYEIATQAIKYFPEDYLFTYRIAMTSTNPTKKLTYLYKAKEIAIKEQKSDTDILSINLDIAQIEDQRIKNACKNIKGFFILPQWEKIFKQDAKYMSANQANRRQNNFYTMTNNCIKNFYGNDLKACLNNVNNEQEKISMQLIEDERHRQLQLLELERINELQQMNANLRYQNSLQAQQNYILNRPRTYNSTTTKYGNTYYTNTYSY